MTNKKTRKEKKRLTRAKRRGLKNERQLNMSRRIHPMFPGYNPWKHMHHNDRHRAAKKAMANRMLKFRRDLEYQDKIYRYYETGDLKAL